MSPTKWWGVRELRISQGIFLRTNTMMRSIAMESSFSEKISPLLLKPLLSHPKYHSCCCCSRCWASQTNVCTFFRYQIHWHENSLTKEPTARLHGEKYCASNNLMEKIASWRNLFLHEGYFISWSISTALHVLGIYSMPTWALNNSTYLYIKNRYNIDF